jgi:streptogramin lyase
MVLVALTFADSAGAVSITEFPAQNPGGPDPLNIIAGPDGNLWWTEGGSNPGLGRMTPTGESLALIEDGSHPVDLVAAPSGWVSWVDEEGWVSRSPAGVFKVSPNNNLKGGAITLTAANEVRFGGSLGAGVAAVCTPKTSSLDHLEGEESCEGEGGGGKVTAMAASPGNTLWSSSPSRDTVKIATAAPLSQRKLLELPIGSGPQGIAIGPEGNAWVAMSTADAIDRIDPNGGRTRFALPSGSEPFDLTYGPDGAFWILESGLGKIGRMTTAGLLTGEYAVPSGFTGQVGITVGPDKNIWFTDSDKGAIGRLIPDPPISGGPPPSPPPASGGPGADKTAPAFIGAPAFSPARFRVSGAKAARSSRPAAPSGSSLKFSLSEAATVTMSVSRKTAGRRVGKKCVAPGKAKPGAKKCSRYVLKGVQTITGKAGANKFAFSGKVGGKALKPGSYQASLTARDAAGNTSAAATANFTIAS